MSFSRVATLLLLTACALTAALAQDERPAVVNGKPVTQGELEALLKLAPAELRSVLTRDPAELLRYYGFVDRLAEIAEKANLPAESPIREQLALARKQVLATAASDRFFTDHPVTADDEQQFYSAHKDDYTSALVNALCVPVRAAEDPSAATKKVEGLAKQLRLGADFDELAEAYPVEGFSHVIKKSDTAIPEAIRTAVFALQPGATTNPIALPNGVYLVRLQTISVQALNDVRGDINQRLSNDRFRSWIEEIRKTVVIAAPSR